MMWRPELQEAEDSLASMNQLSELVSTAVSILGRLLREECSSPEVKIAAARTVLEAASRFQGLSQRGKLMPFEHRTPRALH